MFIKNREIGNCQIPDRTFELLAYGVNVCFNSFASFFLDTIHRILKCRNRVLLFLNCLFLGKKANRIVD